MTREDWFRAARENNTEALKRFVAAGFSKDMKDAAGNSALHEAAGAGSESAADFFLKRGISVNVIGEGGRTPLMVAVLANKPSMVKWLMRQGADPKLKDAENFSPLQLAVREGNAATVEELAPYDDDLDSALMLASLLGKTSVIDSLTNFGASVYARMDGGRTPLMIAAENGHLEAVKLLLEIGSSRHTTNAEGKNAACIAIDAGHPEIAALINREPPPSELAFESPEQISAKMDRIVSAAEAGNSHAPASKEQGVEKISADSKFSKPARKASKPIDGLVLSPAPAVDRERVGPRSAPTPVIMRHYEEADVPIEIEQINGDAATVKISGNTDREVKVKAGDSIPGSRLVVLQVKRRQEDSKVGNGKLLDVSVIEVQDRATGVKREWISGRQSTAHDPVALVEDPATGERYTATAGQRFKTADGIEYRISDVRPNQIIIEDLSDGSVQTVPLRGPRG